MIRDNYHSFLEYPCTIWLKRFEPVGLDELMSTFVGIWKTFGKTLDSPNFQRFTYVRKKFKVSKINFYERDEGFPIISKIG